VAVTFQKMHGAGNDFVLLDLREQAFAIDADATRRLADRHTGIGCDQVLVLRQPANPECLADFEVWNADGSQAEQCGNGVRCIARYLAARGETPAGPFRLGGPRAEIGLSCLANGQVRVDMGAPEFEPDRIPVTAEAADGWYELDLDGKSLLVGAVSMGNPHALLPVADIRSAEVTRLGPLLSRHPCFPQGCNAGFAQIVDRGHILLRVFERGAGETLACGSGACAAMAILRRAGLVDAKVQVFQEGGTLTIEWPGGHAALSMTGPATSVFEGVLL
jgi:diaminopimelate epimerase